ncbi:MAG: type III-A CRISPR-associated RAMP protein Csm4 [Peptococcaceae bacterium]|nr:type III-A CRISPR-associated RAMP protein Csm4 [Peptococcaceae bacterium]NMA14362.1 type III-A CRISPR-associated RAMP protein Csm4 [Clostridia bacterium]
MAYTVYRLKFSTGIHIGQDYGRPSLDDGRMTVHSDTLVAALCCEGVKRGCLSQLVNYFSQDILAISDTFPYKGEELYLPKPFLYTGNRKLEGDSSLKKKFKSLEYIPLSHFSAYLEGLKGAELDVTDLKQDFGSLTVITKVAVTGQPEPQPYHQAYWRFAPNCGLYFILRSRKKEAQQLLEEILTDLGLSGIGGKQSAGLGKFSVEKIDLPEKLTKLLADDQAEYQMLLGTALPKPEELKEALADGWYSLLKRGGFVRSDSYADKQLKKRSIYMLAPGSCVKRRFTGGFFDLNKYGAHPVWRCGNTLFAGVNL